MTCGGDAAMLAGTDDRVAAAAEWAAHPTSDSEQPAWSSAECGPPPAVLPPDRHTAATGLSTLLCLSSPALTTAVTWLPSQWGCLQRATAAAQPSLLCACGNMVVKLRLHGCQYIVDS